MSEWQAGNRGFLPRAVLDVCCGAGGAAHGYAAAGHEVTGVDIAPRLRDDYLRSGAAEFICADALEVLSDTSFITRFDLISYSPPCQRFSAMSSCRPGLAHAYPDLITPGRPLLEASGKPFIIENVSRARPWLQNPVTMCMFTHFGRELYRHRLLESGGGLTLTPPPPPQDPPAGPVHGCDDSQPDYGQPARRTRVNKECGRPHPVPTARAGHWKPGYFVSVAGHERQEPVRKAMEITWMRNRNDVKEAIPPYLAYWVAGQLELMA